MNRKKGIIIGGVVIIVAAFAYLLYGGLDQNVVYFLTPKELLAKGTKAVDVPVRLGGQVKPGSVVWNDTTLSLRFTITDGTSEVAVASKGAPPQMFRDGMGVVVEGRYRADGTFNCTNLMVKHSNEYRPPKAGEKPQDMQKTLIKGA
ncbi:MAG TPA: cytochrome c maturation protein CcmE [Gemmatimonadaceae bacterium]|jgi:cytochrome c-type biogenesis protein CcmE|nr:cytochrome c maturation protein CcmE [Gemmatimonadaceae bacterium]